MQGNGQEIVEKEFDELCERLDFHHVGDIIVLSDKRLHIDSSRQDGRSQNQKGWVYLWVLRNNRQVEILYVGKTGQTLEARAKQHCKGFNTPDGGPGAKNADLIRKALNGTTRARLEIFARLSERTTILDVTDVSLCEVEEIALIKKFQPRWNGRAAKMGL